MMKLSEAGFELIKRFEGCKLTSYHDLVGVLTIGYGHTGRDVHEGQTITQAQADDLLWRDVRAAENCVNAEVKVDLTQSEFDALVSFTFNLGCGRLRSSTLLRKLNDSDFDGAAAEFKRWDRAGGQVVAGLTRRREAEAEMFEGTA